MYRIQPFGATIGELTKRLGAADKWMMGGGGGGQISVSTELPTPPHTPNTTNFCATCRPARDQPD